MHNSGSYNCPVWFLGTPYAQVTWYCACAVNFVDFKVGKRYLSPITSLTLRCSAVKVCEIDKLGSGIFKKCESYLPPVISHVTRRMRSDRSMWWSCEHFESPITQKETGNRRMLKLVRTLDLWSLIVQTSRKSKGRRSRSQGQINILHKNTSNIYRKRHPIVEI